MSEPPKKLRKRSSAKTESTSYSLPPGKCIKKVTFTECISSSDPEVEWEPCSMHDAEPSTPKCEDAIVQNKYRSCSVCKARSRYEANA